MVVTISCGTDSKRRTIAIFLQRRNYMVSKRQKPLSDYPCLSGTGAIPNDRQRGLLISAAQFDNLWQFSSVNSVATDLPSQAALPPLVSSQPPRGEWSLFEAF